MQDFSEPLIYNLCAHTRVLASQTTLSARTLWLVHLKAPEPHGAYLGNFLGGGGHNHSRGKCRGLCCTNPRPRETWHPSPSPRSEHGAFPLPPRPIPLDRLKIMVLSPPEKGACLPR